MHTTHTIVARAQQFCIVIRTAIFKNENSSFSRTNATREKKKTERNISEKDENTTSNVRNQSLEITFGFHRTNHCMSWTRFYQIRLNQFIKKKNDSKVFGVDTAIASCFSTSIRKVNAQNESEREKDLWHLCTYTYSYIYNMSQ